VRWLRRAIPILVVILVAFVYQRVFADRALAPQFVSSQPVAAIGSGEDAVAVAEDGTILAWFPPGQDVHLPRLPLESPPRGARVRGPMLEQVRVLAATPGPLRPYVEGTYFGESGVNVNLVSGIELRFGNAMGAARKWRAAAAVLADPELTAADYVDLHAPAHASVGGSGHTLPPLP
jgi:hypothetical protein